MNKLDPRNIYDDLHQIPELGFEEFKTSAYLADKLEAMGYKVTRNIGGTGVIGETKAQSRTCNDAACRYGRTALSDRRQKRKIFMPAATTPIPPCF